MEWFSGEVTNDAGNIDARKGSSEEQVGGQELCNSAFSCAHPCKTLPVELFLSAAAATSLVSCFCVLVNLSGWETARKTAPPEAAGGSGARLPQWDEHRRRKGIWLLFAESRRVACFCFRCSF